MRIRAKCVLGLRDLDGNGPIYPGCVAEVDDAEGQRAVDGGFAVKMPAASADRPCNISPASEPGENPPEGENAQNCLETSENGNGMIKGHLVREDLEEMTYTQLKELAKDMGIETGKIKSKAGMIEAICAEDVYAEEESVETDELPPTFDAQEVMG